MATNFRTKKITTRYTNINQSGIEKLRATRLAKAKTYAEKRFYSSQAFDKQVRRNIRENRFNKNVSALERITSKIGETQVQRKQIANILGEKTKYSRATGVKRRTNSFTSLKQTKRLQRIEKQISQNKYSLRRSVSRTKKYQEIKSYLPSNATNEEIANALTLSEFYYENKPLIQQHNANVQKKGYLGASRTKTGQALRNKYMETLDEEDADIIDTMLGR